MKLYKYSNHLLLENNGNWGEIAPLPGFSKETFSEALTEVTRLWPDLSQATLPSVRFGWACLQKPLASVHLPLAYLHKPKPGCTTLKLKLGHLTLNDAIALVKEYKHLRLRLDFNKKWPLEKALEFTSHFKPEDFDYLEEPTEDLITFSKVTQFPIAIDESIYTNWASIPTLKAIIVKPTIIGHIPTIPPHLQLILSSSYETGIGLIHIAMLAQNNLPIGLDTCHTDDLLTHPIDTSNGYFSWQNSTSPVNLSKLEEIKIHRRDAKVTEGHRGK